MDVAQRAGVSRTTASFVMTGRRDMRISADAEQRVQQAARELNYRPSLLARSLRTNLSQTIGLLSDMIASEVFAGDVVRGSMTTALLHEHLLFIGETEGDPEVEKRLVLNMLDRGVGGFVYASLSTRTVRISKTLREQQLVLLNCLARGKPIASVVPDDREGGRVAVRIVRSDGGEEVAFAGRPAECLPSSSLFPTLDEAAGFFSLGATGYSATRRVGHYHGMDLHCLSWGIEPLEIEYARSSFFGDTSKFPKGSVELDCALLMRDIDHEWHSRPDLYLSREKTSLSKCCT